MKPGLPSPSIGLAWLLATHPNPTRRNPAEALPLAEKLVAGIGPSTPLSAIEAQDKRASYAPLGPVTRFGEGLERQHVIDAKRVSPDVLDHLFKAKTGEVFAAPVQDGMLIARLKEVNAAAPVGQQAQVQAQLAETLRNDIGNNLMDQVSKAFADRYPVEVDQKSIDSMITGR